MKFLRILDCTLRDGGYINNWNFGEQVIKNIISQLVQADVDVVEVGFLRNCEYDPNKSLFNSVSEIKNVLPQKRRNTKFAAMALHNMYDIDKLEDNDGTIDYIRVTFHDYDIDEGLTFCKKVKEKGYKLFINPINLMGYNDFKLLELIKKVNALKPYAFSIVDTFGSMTKNDLVRIYSLCENNLDKDIVFGLHLHENMAMSYSLAQTFLEIKKYERLCVIDASLNGMGRVPGNLCIELIIDYLNRNYGCQYDIDSALDAIQEYVLPIKEIESWGYKTEYFLSAKYNLHRNYAEYLQKCGRLTTKSINQILMQIDESKKAAYDEAYVYGLYQDFLNKTIDDSSDLEKLTNIFKNRNVVILAPGSSIKTHWDKIVLTIKEKNAITISANFFYEITTDFAFFSNPKRFDEYKNSSMKSQKTICTSNIATEEVDYRINYFSIAAEHDEISDSCGTLVIRLLRNLGVKGIYLAGFDGFVDNSTNYIEGYFKEFYKTGPSDNKKNALEIKRVAKEVPIEFITSSIYETII